MTKEQHAARVAQGQITAGQVQLSSPGVQQPGTPRFPGNQAQQRPGFPQPRPGFPQQRPGTPQQRGPGVPWERPAGAPQQRPGAPLQRPGAPQQRPGAPLQRPGGPQHRPGGPMGQQRHIRPGMPQQGPNVGPGLAVNQGPNRKARTLLTVNVNQGQPMTRGAIANARGRGGVVQRGGTLGRGGNITLTSPVTSPPVPLGGGRGRGITPVQPQSNRQVIPPGTRMTHPVEAALQGGRGGVTRGRGGAMPGRGGVMPGRGGVARGRGGAIAGRGQAVPTSPDNSPPKTTLGRGSTVRGRVRILFTELQI